MAEKRHVQHVRSKVVEQDGQPKLPLAGELLYGELAINYHKGTETVSLKNDQDEIVLFHDEVEISSGTPKVNTEIWIDTGDKTVTEVYTKQQIDSQMSSITNSLSEINAKDAEQDERLDDLEERTEQITGDTIEKINQAISELSGTVGTKVSQLEEKDDEIEGNLDALSGIVDTKLDTSSFNDYSASTEAKIDLISGLAENAYEVQIGTSADTISSNTKVFIDTDADISVQVYTKEQIDSQMSGVTTDITSIKTTNQTQDSRLSALEGKDAAHDTRLNEIDAIDEQQNGRISALEDKSGEIDEISGKVENNIIISSTTPTSDDTELFVDTSNDGPQYEVYTRAQVDAMIADLQRQIDELKP